MYVGVFGCPTYGKRLSFFSTIFAITESAKENKRGGYSVGSGGAWVVLSCLDSSVSNKDQAYIFLFSEVLIGSLFSVSLIFLKLLKNLNFCHLLPSVLLKVVECRIFFRCRRRTSADKENVIMYAGF